MGIDPISIGVIVAGTLLTAGGSVMNSIAQRKEAQARQRQADMEAQNAKLAQVRKARIARAQIIQQGENQGAGGSTSVLGGANNVTNQAQSNLQQIGDQQNINNTIFAAQKDQATAAGIVNIGQGISSVGSTVFENSDYISQKAKTIFGN